MNVVWIFSFKGYGWRLVANFHQNNLFLSLTKRLCCLSLQYLTWDHFTTLTTFQYWKFANSHTSE